MKIYLCGSCATDNRTTMMNIAKILRKAGFTLYCPWELKFADAWDMPQEQWAEKVFENDVLAIDNCDAIIMISYGRMSSAGSNWEQGYAYACNKPIYVIQIGDAQTSLMTFCGCNYFINSNNKDLEKDLKWLVEHIVKKDINQFIKECNTILT